MIANAIFPIPGPLRPEPPPNADVPTRGPVTDNPDLPTPAPPDRQPDPVPGPDLPPAAPPLAPGVVPA